MGCAEEREIGGYFELEESSGDVFYPKLVALNTARNALIYIIKAKGIKKIYIPTYLCAVVAKVLEREQIAYEYYGVDTEFLPIFDKKPKEGEALYVVNFYGLLDNEKLKNLKNRFERIILDNTHAFFQRPIEGIDTIYNCRKFFGVPDGAYLATDVHIAEELPVDVSYERMAHILGRYEKNAQDFYQEFKRVDAEFDNLPLMYMSKLTQNLMKSISYDKCKNRRTENFAKYWECLESINKLKVASIEGAFAYPLYMENAQEMRRKMAEEKIYVPMLWPDVAEKHCAEDVSKEYAEKILPLPCDQRMQLEDVERIVNFVLKNLQAE